MDEKYYEEDTFFYCEKCHKDKPLSELASGDDFICTDCLAKIIDNLYEKWKQGLFHCVN